MSNVSKHYLTRTDLVGYGIKYSNTHLLYLESIDAFPKRIALSPRMKVWDEVEIIAFLEQRQNQRGGVK